ncbi:hypothetical protein Z042_20195 [Chania multitudinisentens RB-25]|uniref:DUF2628 domain-containing protein n=1 Tax=Chania multitudinisentens RB-25 TaxID=1441930 RepID=W0LI34_9GAMM|nr:DUF2628 domain-containing protein [Chania multitudinisentens]AHG21670.1 hypothetical protein Z042_20195 [Chania multitudinisentens RB-25]
MSSELSPKWKARFALFDSAGGDINSPQYKDAIKNMKFFERIKHTSNIFAFFFGIIYFCILGLWKKGLVLFGVILVLNVILFAVESVIGANLDPIARGLNFAYAGASSVIANYAYYIKEVKGLQSWNPLEGFTKKSSARIAKM